MFTLHTGFFARMFTALAVVALVMGGVSVEAMPQVDDSASALYAMAGAGESYARADHKLHGHEVDVCASADDAGADCDAAADTCETGGDCCPHCVTALPLQVDDSFGTLPRVQTAAPQWRVNDVALVTEIRPPIFIS